MHPEKDAAVTSVLHVLHLEDNPDDAELIEARLAAEGIACAMALARERRPEVPFIFISGTIGEEPAIEALKQGVTDYVLKQRLSRLGPAVRRALRDAKDRAERQRMEDKLRGKRIPIKISELQFIFCWK